MSPFSWKNRMMMQQEERELIGQAITHAYFNGRDIRDCLTIVTELMTTLISNTPVKDNQQLKCAIIVQNFANGIVEALLPNNGGSA